jgi:hypothetical protein
MLVFHYLNLNSVVSRQPREKVGLKSVLGGCLHLPRTGCRAAPVRETTHSVYREENLG